MGGPCLRDHRHHWPAGGASRVAAGGGRQGGFAGEPRPVLSAPRPQYLRRAGDPDAFRISLAEDQSDADTITVAIGQRLGDPHPKRLGDSLPIARRHRHAITVAERQRETFELALA